ncbi:MAG TPA: hypothetical protein VFO44_05455 [Steroidobacteraceae bacterium]|nr:hypothetical protein [Steroidobacteraceae bacterium]
MDSKPRPPRLKPAHLAMLAVAVVVIAAWAFVCARHAGQPVPPTPAAARAQIPEPYRRQLEAMMGPQAQGLDAAQLQAMQRAMQQATQQVGGAPPLPAATTPPKVEMLKETATSVELDVTLPDGETARGGVSFEPNRTYTPTAAELEAQSTLGRSVFGVHFTRSTAADGRAVLSYVVPGNALPAALRERLYGRSSETAGPQLIRAAWAQGVLNAWTGVQTGYAIGGHLSGLQPKAPWDKAAKAYKEVSKALDMAEQFDQWMLRLDALETCARNPTQTLTQNAYRDNPAYQQQTLDAIQQARSDVQQATGLNYVNQEATVAMQLTKGPGLLSETTGKVSDWNDAALKDIGEGLVQDASKLVDCDLARPPPSLGDGTIVYHQKRAQWQFVGDEEWESRGTVSIFPGPADTLVVRGEGAFKGHHISSPPADLIIRCDGQSAYRGSGGNGMVTISGTSVGGTCAVGTAKGPTQQRDYGAADAGFDCRFDKVDWENGGSYEVHAEGEESRWATCTLEIKTHKDHM